MNRMAQLTANWHLENITGDEPGDRRQHQKTALEDSTRRQYPGDSTRRQHPEDTTGDEPGQRTMTTTRQW